MKIPDYLTEKLINLNQHLDQIIESSFDGIYITDGEANTLMLNKSYENITGLKRGELLYKNMADLVAAGVVSQSGSLLVRQKMQPVTLFQEFKTGKKALITSSPIFDREGNISLIVTNVRDMTEIYSLKEELELLKSQISKVDNMVVADQAMNQVLKMASKVAAMDATVLILGDTGVGKEVLAEYIHKNSPRAKAPLIKINCGAIPPNLIEAELFGYVRGAFTGADRNGRMGFFELAHQGTLFLDEIGELKEDMQVKLLQVLQTGEIRRIGSDKVVKADFRIIAATNKNLEEMVKKRQFRQDLYYRICVFPIKIPALKERPGDIEALIWKFTEDANRKYHFNKSFSKEALILMKSYHWPGNVRELRNIVDRAIIISDGEIIREKDIAIQSFGDFPDTTGDSGGSINLKAVLSDIEFSYLEKAYHQYHNVRDAAASLGMDASTFARKRSKKLKG